MVSPLQKNSNYCFFLSDKESKEMSTSSDPDKDIDSVLGPGLDVASCRRAFQYLAKVSVYRIYKSITHTY